jgi:hypothetical protein
MKKQAFRAFALGLTILAAAASWAEEPVAAVDATAAETAAVTSPATTTEQATNTETTGKLKVQNIRVEDRFGSIEEDRIQAMRSEVRYVPTGSADGYNLIGSENSQGKARNAHSEGDNLMIPSWKLFAW